MCIKYYSHKKDIVVYKVHDDKTFYSYSKEWGWLTGNHKWEHHYYDYVEEISEEEAFMEVMSI